MHHIILVRPPALLAYSLSRFPPHQRLSFSEVKELAGEGRLLTTNDGIVLLVHTLTPPPYQRPTRSFPWGARLVG